MKSFNDFQRKHIQPNDIKYVSVDGDPDFSIEHNNQVIKRTLERTEKVKRQKQREYEEGIKERAWAAGEFIKSLNKGQGDSSIEKYFGKEYLKKLQGEKILAKYEPYKEMLRSHYGAKQEESKAT